MNRRGEFAAPTLQQETENRLERMVWRFDKLPDAATNSPILISLPWPTAQAVSVGATSQIDSFLLYSGARSEAANTHRVSDRCPYIGELFGPVEVSRPRSPNGVLIDVRGEMTFWREVPDQLASGPRPSEQFIGTSVTAISVGSYGNVAFAADEYGGPRINSNEYVPAFGRTFARLSLNLTAGTVGTSITVELRGYSVKGGTAGDVARVTLWSGTYATNAEDVIEVDFEHLDYLTVRHTAAGGTPTGESLKVWLDLYSE